MNTSRISISITVAIILMMIACTPTTSDTSIHIPSWHENYSLLLKEAQRWRTDAYLHDARIFLYPRSSDSHSISASFYAPSKVSESLVVNLLQDGTIRSETFIHEYPIYHHKPITENDWKIDSQEAIEYMLSGTDQRSLDPNKNTCSFMMLERALAVEDQPTIWFLSLWDCSEAVQRLYMDANSGEIFDSSEINVKPTRFPTPTP